MKKVEKIRLSKKILKDLKELSKTLPAVVINNKVYYVTPRALLAENLCKKYRFSPKKLDRLLDFLKKCGLIHKTVKKYNGKTALHIHIVGQ